MREDEGKERRSNRKGVLKNFIFVEFVERGVHDGSNLDMYVIIFFNPALRLTANYKFKL